MAPRKLSVLIVDDDAMVRSVLAEQIREAGHSVLLAEDGDVALELTAKHAPDVAIVDIIMPGKDGVQTITNMRITHPGVRIVAISGDTNSEVYLRAAANMGVRAGLQKPFSRQQVLDALSRAAS